MANSKSVAAAVGSKDNRTFSTKANPATNTVRKVASTRSPKPPSSDTPKVTTSTRPIEKVPPIAEVVLTVEIVLGEETLVRIGIELGIYRNNSFNSMQATIILRKGRGWCKIIENSEFNSMSPNR